MKYVKSSAVKSLILAGLVCLGAEHASAQAADVQTANKSHMKLQGSRYHDYFTIVGAKVSSIQAEGNLSITSQTDTSFVVSALNTNIDNGGMFTLRVINPKGACELVIEDASYMMNPKIKSVNCAIGISFSYDHPQYTYQYTLMFD